MKPAAFDYERPTSLEAALAALKQGPEDTRILAGGQSLVPMMNFRLARPGRLIDINRIAELDYYRIEGGDLAVGALARHAALKDSALVAEACPLMHAAYDWVAHGSVRNRGTLCGNLCHADPASEMPAVMLAVDAVMVVQNSERKRSLPAGAFFLGQFETARAEDEILVEVRIPVAPPGRGWGFHEVCLRKGDFAIVAVAATLELAGGEVSAASIAMAGVGQTALRLPEVEATLLGRKPDEQAFARVAVACAAAVEPASDIHGSADYRRDLIKALVFRSLRDAQQRCG